MNVPTCKRRNNQIYAFLECEYGILSRRTNPISPLLRRKIGRAMADYTMLADGDRILVAVSGGIDSLVLIRILQLWKINAPISYAVHAIHVDMQPEDGRPGEVARNVQATLQRCSIPCQILPATWFPDEDAIEEGRVKDVCFRCARSRRTQLFADRKSVV